MNWACSKRVKPSINSMNDPLMNTPRFWLVIPAAGVGARMQADRPKQYLQLAGRCLIEHSLDCFLGHPGLIGVVVCLAPNDPYWPTLACAQDPRIQRVDGGAERADSVLQGLLQLTNMGANEQDWVLVHDAARPNLSRFDLDLLLTELAEDAVGGLLAVPVRDTLKRADSAGRVAATIDRSDVWQAYTPQMFRCSALQHALADALVANVAITDEASALEWAGHAPRLIEGRADNLKITRPEDLEWLRQRWLHKQ
jgi:2-C-methyl-D-erythritol 4-phosphate cytidylyltransferase